MEVSRVVKPVHTAVPGRVRLHVTGLYRSQDLKRHLESRLHDEKLISRAKANPLTGHLLVTFPATQKLAQVISIVETVVKSRNGSKPVVGVGKILSPSGDDPPNRSTKKKKSAISRRRLVRLVGTSEEQKALAWHLMEFGEVARFLETSPRDGLPSIAAQERFRRFGPNVLPEAVPRSGLKIFFGQFASVPVALLGLASGISVLTGGLIDAAVILGVVVINAIIGYVTESQAEKTIHSLKTLVRPRAIAVREGKLLEIGAEEIVPGDLIVLRPGNYIPADARIVESARLSIDESALTGEGVPVGKNPLRIVSEGGIPLSDRTNMCYMGTLVTGGQGLAIAVATGVTRKWEGSRPWSARRKRPRHPWSASSTPSGPDSWPSPASSAGLCSFSVSLEATDSCPCSRPPFLSPWPPSRRPSHSGHNDPRPRGP